MTARQQSWRLSASVLCGTLVLVASCGSGSGVDGDGDAGERLTERLNVLASHVESWRNAPSLAEAQRAAEAAANHVVGPNGPGFGDRDRDGEVRGPTDAGILPGLEGAPAGFALEAVNAGAPDCVVRDILGGAWNDPARRWAELDNAIANWQPTRNTFPSLASHAQRIVGWATLTLATGSPEEAKTYGGHAELHVAISLSALDEC